MCRLAWLRPKPEITSTLLAPSVGSNNSHGSRTILVPEHREPYDEVPLVAGGLPSMCSPRRHRRSSCCRNWGRPCARHRCACDRPRDGRTLGTDAAADGNLPGSPGPIGRAAPGRVVSPSTNEFRTCWGRVEELLVAEELWNDHKKLIFFPVASAATCTDSHLEVDQRSTLCQYKAVLDRNPRTCPFSVDVRRRSCEGDGPIGHVLRSCRDSTDRRILKATKRFVATLLPDLTALSRSSYATVAICLPDQTSLSRSLQGSVSHDRASQDYYGKRRFERERGICIQRSREAPPKGEEGEEEEEFEIARVLI
ncbi:hypothetical protein Taro_043022 [Colocasia esculenta]|uniref:Uncharacterized protein n=1 Tax=Colocasia esculenta TaxID=4460 RepID=A0A843WFD1_COLES|nr:hypothetical protein [Colocasia esculenta]